MFPGPSIAAVIFGASYVTVNARMIVRPWPTPTASPQFADEGESIEYRSGIMNEIYRKLDSLYLGQSSEIYQSVESVIAKLAATPTYNIPAWVIEHDFHSPDHLPDWFSALPTDVQERKVKEASGWEKFLKEQVSKVEADALRHITPIIDEQSTETSKPSPALTSFLRFLVFVSDQIPSNATATLPTSKSTGLTTHEIASTTTTHPPAQKGIATGGSVEWAVIMLGSLAATVAVFL